MQTASLAASIVDKHAKTVIGQRLRGDGFKSGGVIAGSAMQEDERHTVGLSESLHIEGLRMPLDRNAENQQGQKQASCHHGAEAKGFGVYVFHVTRRTRDLCEVIEITPDGLWGQSLDFFCHDFELGDK